MKLFGVLIASLLSAIIGFIFAFWYLDKIFPFRQNQLIPIYEKKETLAFSLAVSLLSFFYYISRWISILMLGYFATSKEVGIYGAVDRVIPIINLPLISINSIFPPMIAELYGKRDLAKLESLYKVETKWAISLGLPFFLVLSIFARPIMSIFGSGFAEGAVVLIMLSVAQMIVVSAGSQGQVLMMTGRQNLTLINNAFFAVTNIILNYFLIPRYGIIGAAVSGLICTGTLNIIEVGQVYYLFRIHPFRSDLVKPLAAAVIVSCLTLLLNRLGFFNLSQMNIFLLGICVAIFLGLYFLLIIALKLSDEDRFVIDAILKRFLWQGKQKP
jgi:O-antigen/teichoic acid export membrane protein